MNPSHLTASTTWKRTKTAVSALALGLTGVALACSPAMDSEIESTGDVSQPLSWSNSPPGGLTPSQVPQFVSVSFDDNFNSNGFSWCTSYFQNLENPVGSGNSLTFDGTSARTSFFHNGDYIYNSATWSVAVSHGHETADHTSSHGNGLDYSTGQWSPQVLNCRSTLSSGLSIPQSDIVGFRAPFLGYNDALYSVLDSASPAFTYDSSIQACWRASEDGTNCAWPYTLDSGSPDAANVLSKFGSQKARSVGNHAGLWEVPVSALIVPPDSLATQYGFTPGLRSRVASALGANTAPSFYEESTGKVAGLDVTMIVDGQMTKAEALATLKYSLDLRLSGNRAPLVFVAHTHVYADGYSAAPNVQNTADRRAIIEEFLNYALTKPDVRVRPVADIVSYMENPSALGQCTPDCSGKECGDDGCGGSCGSCDSGETCSSVGICEAECTPDCSGKECGGDGCGGSCGSCGALESCNTSGQCETGSCTAPTWISSTAYVKDDTVSFQGYEYTARWYTQNQQPDLNDGPNGSGQPWTEGVACSGSCTPSCSGKECGDDGCGGSCGSCGTGETCNAGTCESTCTPSCSGKECGDDGCGGSCGSCGTGETCNAGSCESTCTPACQGKECGDDSCGGICGVCDTGETCNASGQCEATGGSCSGIPNWALGSYSGGDRVQNVGNLYECKPYPYNGWCGVSSAYEPGVGFAWQDAWVLVSACN